MTERTECVRCRKLDQRDEPFDVYPMPSLMQRKGSDELIMLSADDVNEPDHLCDECCAAYASAVAEFMGENFVIVVPVDEDGMDLAEGESDEGDASSEESTT